MNGSRAKKNPGGRAGAGTGDHLAADLFSPIMPQDSRPCQAALEDAQREAQQAAALWQSCLTAGDHEGAAVWRRKQFERQEKIFHLARERRP